MIIQAIEHAILSGKFEGPVIGPVCMHLFSFKSYTLNQIEKCLKDIGSQISCSSVVTNRNSHALMIVIFDSVIEACLPCEQHGELRCHLYYPPRSPFLTHPDHCHKKYNRLEGSSILMQDIFDTVLDRHSPLVYNFLLDKNDNIIGNRVESDDDVGTACIQNEENQVVEMECTQKEGVK